VPKFFDTFITSTAFCWLIWHSQCGPGQAEAFCHSRFLEPSLYQD
jgi:hypothetical protein